MNLNKIIILLLFFNLYACADYKTTKKTQEDTKQYFSSSGFALIYQEEFYKNKIVNKRLNDDGVLVMHRSLNKNTLVILTNPDNSKVIKTKIYKKANYPKIFNVVINREVASILELDIDNPFVELNELKKNITFIAKKGNTYDEEKNVADKAPVDEIKMNDLMTIKKKVGKKLSKKDNFILVISDFYFLDSANNLKKELTQKLNINNILIKKINNKYRLLVGPFESFNALKTTYISLNNLGFEGLNVYRE